jgi:hypothetical protein
VGTGDRDGILCFEDSAPSAFEAIQNNPWLRFYIREDYKMSMERKCMLVMSKEMLQERTLCPCLFCVWRPNHSTTNCYSWSSCDEEICISLLCVGELDDGHCGLLVPVEEKGR